MDPTGAVMYELIAGLGRAGVHIPEYESTSRDPTSRWLDIIEGQSCARLRDIDPCNILESSVDEAMKHAFKVASGRELRAEELSDDFYDEGIEACGIEWLGFYRPFHWGLDGWGIYLFPRRIAELADRLSARVATDPDLMHGALLYLVIRHEWHHFIEEIALSHAEILRRTELFRPYMDHYRSNWPNSVENEALANAKALVDVRRVLGHQIKPLKGSMTVNDVLIELSHMMRSARGSYREFDQYEGRHAYRQGLGNLLARFIGMSYGPEVVLIAEAAKLRHNIPEQVPLRYVGWE